MHYFPKIPTLYSHFIEANGPVRMKTLPIRLFVDEIKDLKSMGYLANFMHYVTDLYKFISPRFRRGNSL